MTEPVKLYYCPLCDRAYPTMKEMEEHCKKHPEFEPYMIEEDYWVRFSTLLMVKTMLNLVGIIPRVRN